MVFIMLGGKILRKDTIIPFGPYLAGGTLISILTKTPYGVCVVSAFFTGGGIFFIM